MDFKEYQVRSAETAIYPTTPPLNWAYPLIGLSGEVGELSNKLKKVMRDKIDLDQLRIPISHEIGDVLWYISQLANELDLSLDHIAMENINKLESRKKRGHIGGDGDNR